MNENGEFYLADAIAVIEEILASGGEFKLYPKGTSMLPLIVQGRDAVVLSRKSETVPAKKHDIAFYRRNNGQFVLHRVVNLENDGTYTMCGDNQLTLERGILPEQIIGTVTKIYRKGAEISQKNLFYRIYIFFWCNMLFRRYYRAVKDRLAGIRKKMRKS